MRKIIYQMLPRLWGNEKNFCGKLDQIDDPTLDYLRSLGITDLWCTGILRHATRCACCGCTPSHEQFVKGEAGSPYAITDYYDINPYLAQQPERRMEEWENLVQRVHKHGLKLILDFVPNHVARDYQGAATPPGLSRLGEGDDPNVHWRPENDFYYYPGEALRLPKPSADPYVEYPAKASGNAFTPAPDIQDWYETIRLNYCDFHTATWDKMHEILRFWASKGVDGFRCDMVELVPQEFFRWVIAEMKAEFPQVFFVAEVYDKARYRCYTEDVGFDILYDKSCFYDTLRSVTVGECSARALTSCWQYLGHLQPRMLNFLENHDEQRIGSDFFAGDARKGLAAWAVDSLFSCAPLMLYFGQEVGERGMGEEPFSGLNGRTSIFDWCAPEGLVALYRYVHGGKGLSREQRSLLSRYRETLRLCSKETAFATGGNYDLGYCQNDPSFLPDRHFAWLRFDGRKYWIIATNFSDQPAQLLLHIPREAFQCMGQDRDAETIALSVGAFDYAIERRYF